jgi:hypothetical protein
VLPAVRVRVARALTAPAPAVLSLSLFSFLLARRLALRLAVCLVFSLHVCSVVWSGVRALVIVVASADFMCP